ncbi:hypothetical protein BGZ73_001538, partial [Actinomortierella ambigua]
MDPLGADSVLGPSVSSSKAKKHHHQQITKSVVADPDLLPSPPLSADDGPTDPLSAGLSTKQQQQQQQHQHQQRRLSTSVNRGSVSSFDTLPPPRRGSQRQISSSSSSLSDTPYVTTKSQQRREQTEPQQQDQEHSPEIVQQLQQTPWRPGKQDKHSGGGQEDQGEGQTRELTNSKPLDHSRHVQVKNLDLREEKEGEGKDDGRQGKWHKLPEGQQLQQQAQALHPLASQQQQHDAESNGENARENDDQATLTQGSMQEGEVGERGSIWSGQHPLFQDFAAPATDEPEALDDATSTFTSGNDATTAARFPATSRHHHHKGQSMSVVEVTQQGLASRSTRARQMSTQPASAASPPRVQLASTPQLPSSPSSPGMLRRRAAGGVKDTREPDRSSAHTDQRRVIIHPVAPGDTLQGLGLYYGIQIAVLKKSNKLWTNDSIHSRKYLYIPVEECAVLRQTGARIDEEKNKVILPPPRTNTPSRGSSVYGDHRIRKMRSKSLLSSPHLPSLSNWNTPESTTQKRAMTPEVPRTNSYGVTPSSLDPSLSLSSSLPDDEHENRGGPFYHQLLSEEPLGADTPLAMISHPRPRESDTPTLPPIGAKSALSPALGKSKAAPPIPSSAMTTTTLLTGSVSSPLSPKRMNIAPTSETHKEHGGKGKKHRRHGGRGSSSGGGGTSSEASTSSIPSLAVPFSEDLPATLMVHPSMTHEALAHRFKQMESASKENRSNNSGGGGGGGSISSGGGLQRELRTNPVHSLHQVVDTRPLHYHQHQTQHQQSASYTVTATRKSSTDYSSSEAASSTSSSMHARLLAQHPSLLAVGGLDEGKPSERTLVGGGDGETADSVLARPLVPPGTLAVEKEGAEEQKEASTVEAIPLPPEDAFIIYGHHEYIYRDQNQSSTSSDEDSVVSDSDDSSDGSSFSSSSGDELYQRDQGEAAAATTTRGGHHGKRPKRQRRPRVHQQDLITVPAGRLSFFPSAEYSKRLETPEPILRIQEQSATAMGDDGGYFPPYGSISGRQRRRSKSSLSSSYSASGPSSRASTQSAGSAGSLAGYLPNLPSLFSSISKGFDHSSVAAPGGRESQRASGSGATQAGSRPQKGGTSRRRTAMDANTFKVPSENEGSSSAHGQASPASNTAAPKGRPTTMHPPPHHHHGRG